MKCADRTVVDRAARRGEERDGADTIRVGVEEGRDMMREEGRGIDMRGAMRPGEWMFQRLD